MPMELSDHQHQLPNGLYSGPRSSGHLSNVQKGLVIVVSLDQNQLFDHFIAWNLVLICKIE